MTYDSIDVVGQTDDIGMEDDKDESSLSFGEPVAQREEPLGSVNGKPETDDKENNNGISTDEPQAVRYDKRQDKETLTENAQSGADNIVIVNC